MENDYMHEVKLHAQLTYPQGDDAVAARLVIVSDVNRVVVAEIDMTEHDLANFFAGRRIAENEGNTFLANPKWLEVAHKRRRAVQCVLDSRESENVVHEWAQTVRLAEGAHSVRVARRRAGGWVVTLHFYFDRLESVIENDAVMRHQDRLNNYARNFGARSAATRTQEQS